MWLLWLLRRRRLRHWLGHRQRRDHWRDCLMHQLCIFDGNLNLTVHRMLLLLCLQFLGCKLSVLLVFLRLALGFCHAGVLDNLCIWRQLGWLTKLIGTLHQLLQLRHDLLEHLLCIQAHMLLDRGKNLVNDAGQLWIIVVIHRFSTTSLHHITVHAVQIPQGHVLLDVFDGMWGELRGKERV